MSARSVWSGGVVWGDGTPAGDSTDAYWMPDGATASGPLIPDVAIGGTLYTDSVSAASWSLGISGFLADLAPTTASITLVGQVTGVPGDDVVISSPLGVQWVGRLDSANQTRDTAGDWWTTVTATDIIGVLGAAYLNELDFGGYEYLDDKAAFGALHAGVELDIVDDSSGLPLVDSNSPYSGDLLALINNLAKGSNVMLAMTRDGRIHAVIRESVSPSSVLTLTGADAPADWTLTYSIDSNINRWDLYEGVAAAGNGEDSADILRYGRRVYNAIPYATFPITAFDDWIAYGGSQRPIASGTMTVASWAQEDLILLDPFQWVTESGTDWQVMSVAHDVTVGGPWTVTITADNLLDLL